MSLSEENVDLEEVITDLFYDDYMNGAFCTNYTKLNDSLLKMKLKCVKDFFEVYPEFEAAREEILNCSFAQDFEDMNTAIIFHNDAVNALGNAKNGEIEEIIGEIKHFINVMVNIFNVKRDEDKKIEFLA